jgi:hypothetical protein
LSNEFHADIDSKYSARNVKCRKHQNIKMEECSVLIKTLDSKGKDNKQHEGDAKKTSNDNSSSNCSTLLCRTEFCGPLSNFDPSLPP